MSERPDITAFVQSLTGSGVAVAAMDIGHTKGALFPQERAAIARATNARKQEFATGREAARLAMRRLGVTPAEIPMGADRAPVWPKGLRGSISHSGDICVAVVSRSDVFQSVGIDIETDTPLDDDLLDTICTDTEQRWLLKQDANARGKLAKLIFSAKECAYKCQYPLSLEVIDFMAFEISLNLGNHRFDACFTRQIGPFAAGTRFLGHYGAAFGSFATIICLPAPKIATFRD
ncbi:MAG: 4'-phosphopantetheinyl transferase superfamily protein [Rhodobacterales bacterium]|nr:4'-phosphopantetheinyl transferase superfamily protein [Rhodobacterales bacterium]